MTEASSSVLGAVLAGGRSSRLGRSKATAELDGRALIDYPLAALDAAGLETVVVAKPDTALPSLEAPVWLEPAEPSHPLLGITTALARSGGRPVIVCACDLPFVTPALVTHLCSFEEPLVVPAAGGRLHPLLARYDPALLDALSAALDEDRSLQSAIVALDAVVVEEQDLSRFGDPARLLFNVNTPPDLALAERMQTGLGQRRRSCSVREHEQLLRHAYDAFNSRDIEAALSLAHPDVDWPNGMEGGRVHGHAGVRGYWTRQFRLIDSHVDPQRFTTDEEGRVVVDVHQVVRDPEGTLISDQQVQHVYAIRDGLIERMDIREA